MSAEKPSNTKPMNWEAMLARGRKNLSALKAAHANPKTSPAGKKTMAQMIVDQSALNAKLEKALGLQPEAATAQPAPRSPLGHHLNADEF